MNANTTPRTRTTYVLRINGVDRTTTYTSKATAVATAESLITTAREFGFSSEILVRTETTGKIVFYATHNTTPAPATEEIHTRSASTDTTPTASTTSTTPTTPNTTPRPRPIHIAAPNTPCGWMSFDLTTCASVDRGERNAIHVLNVSLPVAEAGTALCAFHSPYDVTEDDRDAQNAMETLPLQSWETELLSIAPTLPTVPSTHEVPATPTTPTTGMAGEMIYTLMEGFRYNTGTLRPCDRCHFPATVGFQDDDQDTTTALCWGHAYEWYPAETSAVAIRPNTGHTVDSIVDHDYTWATGPISVIGTISSMISQGYDYTAHMIDGVLYFVPTIIRTVTTPPIATDVTLVVRCDWSDVDWTDMPFAARLYADLMV